MGRGGTPMTMEQVVNTNYFGPRRVNDAFGKVLKSPGGRIVNIASASGPMYLSKIRDGDPLKEKLTKPWTIKGGIAELDSIAQNMKGGDAYGASKALLNAYTGLHAKTDRNLIINSCSPGFIVTDMTMGMGASSPPSKGAVPPCFLMMDAELEKQQTGRYYGSDCVRSPVHFYRGPGEAPYVNDEDLAEALF
jgi:carbonyl reductase 1